ncbi:hypothetical protein [Chitinophaga arvensicola]|uniref:Uncharacterized protein n=1 Tax=Chitinophaga arvensicola TaxID=29529 RepID=A0A1I0PN14_9BACT|nr:hypothetical protein [Chitinophaga arvensicola]SEW15739.1 hypothetical protein SAMN04488122_0876 [Chitinophaga arvensicola]
MNKGTSTFASDWAAFQKYDKIAEKALGGKEPDRTYLQSKVDVLRTLTNKHKPGSMSEVMQMRDAYMAMDKTQKMLNSMAAKKVLDSATKVKNVVVDAANTTGKAVTQGVTAAGRNTNNLLRRINRNPFVRLLTESIRLLYNLAKLLVRAAGTILIGSNKVLTSADNKMRTQPKAANDTNALGNKADQQQQRDNKPSLAVAQDGTMLAVKKDNKVAAKKTSAFKKSANNRVREVSRKGPSNSIKVR